MVTERHTCTSWGSRFQYRWLWGRQPAQHLKRLLLQQLRTHKPVNVLTS